MKEKIAKYKFTHLLIILLVLSGCITTKEYIPIESKETMGRETSQGERNKIFKVYDNNVSNAIILAYEEIYQNTFDIAKNYLQYAKTDSNPTYDGFYIWLMKNLWYKDMFEKDEFGIGKWLIDNRFQDKEYQEIMKNYELYKKMKAIEK